MIKGGYQILDFSRLPLYTSGADDDIYISTDEISEEELKKIANDMFNAIVNTSKPILITGFNPKTDDFEGYYRTNDFYYNKPITLEFNNNGVCRENQIILSFDTSNIPLSNSEVTVTITRESIVISASV